MWDLWHLVVDNADLPTPTPTPTPSPSPTSHGWLDAGPLEYLRVMAAHRSLRPDADGALPFPVTVSISTDSAPVDHTPFESSEAYKNLEHVLHSPLQVTGKVSGIGRAIRHAVVQSSVSNANIKNESTRKSDRIHGPRHKIIVFLCDHRSDGDLSELPPFKYREKDGSIWDLRAPIADGIHSVFKSPQKIMYRRLDIECIRISMHQTDKDQSNRLTIVDHAIEPRVYISIHHIPYSSLQSSMRNLAQLHLGLYSLQLDIKCSELIPGPIDAMYLPKPGSYPYDFFVVNALAGNLFESDCLLSRYMKLEYVTDGSLIKDEFVDSSDMLEYPHKIVFISINDEQMKILKDQFQAKYNSKIYLKNAADSSSISETLSHTLTLEGDSFYIRFKYSSLENKKSNHATASESSTMADEKKVKIEFTYPSFLETDEFKEVKLLLSHFFQAMNGETILNEDLSQKIIDSFGILSICFNEINSNLFPSITNPSQREQAYIKTIKEVVSLASQNANVSNLHTKIYNHSRTHLSHFIPFIPKLLSNKNVTNPIKQPHESAQSSSHKKPKSDTESKKQPSYLRVPPPPQQPPKKSSNQNQKKVVTVWDWATNRYDAVGLDGETDKVVELDGRRDGMNWNDPNAPIADRDKSGYGGKLLPIAFD